MERGWKKERDKKKKVKTEREKKRDINQRKMSERDEVQKERREKEQINIYQSKHTILQLCYSCDGSIIFYILINIPILLINIRVLIFLTYGILKCIDMCVYHIAVCVVGFTYLTTSLLLNSLCL